MKNKWIVVFIAIYAAMLVIGCGRGETDEKSEVAKDRSDVIFLKDLDVENYVTLGVYKGIEVVINQEDIDEAEWQKLVEQVYFDSVTAEKGGILDRAVEEGDTVYIDFEGKKDGIAFPGGTAYNSPLTIGSGQFIEGFEAGLIGVMPGETVDLNLTFPENYGNADLDGQEVVFTVTVNYIQPIEMKDEVVASWGEEEFSNLEELRQYVYEYMVESSVYNYEMRVEGAILQQFIDNCMFKELPNSILNQQEQYIRDNIENTAAMYGVDADTFTSYYYNTTLDGFITDYLEDSVKERIAFQAVANAENLNISDEELEEKLLEAALNEGYASVEEYANETERENIREYYMYNNVITFLVENAIVTG